MPRIHLVEGPVGAGKTTFAAELGKKHRAPCMILDDWFVNLFSPDRPAVGVLEWYAERKERCLSQLWKMASDIVDAGHDVVLEFGLIDRASRARLYGLVSTARYDLTVYVLDAPREVRRERVRDRNRDKGPTYSMEVSDHIFDVASNFWEPFDDDETGARDVRFIVSG
jgi:predicted kinase